MRAGRTLLPCCLVLVSCLLLGGCITLEPSLRTSHPPAPQPQDCEEKDLRIPESVVPASAEVPLVPVPLPPLGDPRRGRETIRPASHGVPVAGGTPLAPPPPLASAEVPTTSPSPRPDPASPLTPRQLLDRATARYAGMDSYIVRLVRKEVLRDREGPKEVLMFKFRKEPWSVHFKWLSPDGAGREALYVKGHYQDKIHTLLADGDIPLMPAGKRMAFAPDSILVRTASRTPITEAGFGASLDRLARIVRALEAGDRRLGTLTALGPVARPEFPRPLDGLEEQIPPRSEQHLPQGGRRFYGFDPDSHLPVFIRTVDDRGREVEYYAFDRIQFPVHLDNDDFDPDRLWARPTGARAAAGN